MAMHTNPTAILSDDEAILLTWLGSLVDHSKKTGRSLRTAYLHRYIKDILDCVERLPRAADFQHRTLCSQQKPWLLTSYRFFCPPAHEAIHQLLTKDTQPLSCFVAPP